MGQLLGDKSWSWFSLGRKMIGVQSAGIRSGM